MTIEEVLQQRFGFTSFRPGQKQVIQNVLNQQDVLAILPTGSGKSLCYQLPTYIQGGLCLIISPLISLMQDQVIQLNLQGEKRVAMLNSALNLSEQHYLLSHLDHYLFVFASPETLFRPDVLPYFKKIRLSLLVIDEAHCISQWGSDFRPSYARLGELRKTLIPKSTLMLTATATKKVQADILTQLDLPNAQRVIYSVDRTNIYLAAVSVDSDQDKQQQLLTILKKIQKPGIIYFSSRSKAEEIAQFIQETLHVPTAFYHGALSNRDRYLIQQQFMAGELQVICATNAFGMGINKQNVRFVIHYHAPNSFESYLQEIGRAGRDGHQSIAILFSAKTDLHLQQSLLETGLPPAALVKRFYQQPDFFKAAVGSEFELLRSFYSNHFAASKVTQMLENKRLEKLSALAAFNQYVQSDTCRRQALLTYFGETQLPEHTKHCCSLGFDDNILQTLLDLGLTATDEGTILSTGKVLNYRQILTQLFNLL